MSFYHCHRHTTILTATLILSCPPPAIPPPPPPPSPSVHQPPTSSPIPHPPLCPFNSLLLLKSIWHPRFDLCIKRTVYITTSLVGYVPSSSIYIGHTRPSIPDVALSICIKVDNLYITTSSLCVKRPVTAILNHLSRTTRWWHRASSQERNLCDWTVKLLWPGKQLLFLLNIHQKSPVEKNRRLV